MRAQQAFIDHDAFQRGGRAWARLTPTGAHDLRIGQAQHEATEVDRCSVRYANRDLQDYLVPVNLDIRDLQVILVPEVGHTVNPAGVNGLEN
ncbi:hypothetical protein [Mesorhizobium sp.]|nr:hypothetical protein [Mesorhizobium sp.]RWA62471.1 MAG: hypothetical protein EOQ28_31095 [Mesorhizobium sp.]RWB94254.1 MAG: hypothetical protein EOQ57_32185 [Mesorhizobium sp.]RWG78176.1 MAG: hypothetical protein EOQ69_27135 [Mesorhizobium sp.]RWG90846.1 MAG: hypothetical protein EOQ70_03915 [Mesorhizobium sp.]RWK04155.1 MAG: hypothetical protein EOR39_29370 [Mesorhizobium sp.]